MAFKKRCPAARKSISLFIFALFIFLISCNLNEKSDINNVLLYPSKANSSIVTNKSGKLSNQDVARGLVDSSLVYEDTGSLDFTDDRPSWEELSAEEKDYLTKIVGDESGTNLLIYLTGAYLQFNKYNGSNPDDASELLDYLKRFPTLTNKDLNELITNPFTGEPYRISDSSGG